MRVKKDKVDISYKDTRRFFEERSNKYNEENPYSTTMYQDNNKELVQKRNIYEQNKILPYLELNTQSKVLDIACGIGRWADAIKENNENIAGYVGVDFSEGLIELAKKRNQDERFRFYTGSVSQLEELRKAQHWGTFNSVIMAGILIYLNDGDVQRLFEELDGYCDQNAVIYLREPIALDTRLTLKQFFSEELSSEYNAVYRTKEELMSVMENTVLKKGFKIERQDFMFDEDKDLNNRKETSQYFFIIKR